MVFWKNNCIDMVSYRIKFVFYFWSWDSNQVFPDCYCLVGKDSMECGMFRMGADRCLSFVVDGYGGVAGSGGVLECPALEQMLAVRTPSLMASLSLLLSLPGYLWPISHDSRDT